MSVKLEQVDADTVRVDLGDHVYLVSAECPHRKGRMLFSHVGEKRLRITCPLHHSTFELETGRLVSGPACHPLRVQRVSPP